MEKKAIWAIIIVVLIIIAGIWYFTASTSNGDGDADTGTGNAEDLSDLQSDEEVFNQIDDSVNYIE